MLLCDGEPDEVIAAGLLHDVLEKTATTSAELHRRFGARIARLVESVSDDPSIGEYRSRKRELRDRVARGDSNTRAIFVADKISKVRELALLPARRLGETKVRAELAHYRASLEMLAEPTGTSPSWTVLMPSSTSSSHVPAAELRAPDRPRALQLEARPASTSTI